jgi:hypothetical protein
MMNARFLLMATDDVLRTVYQIFPSICCPIAPVVRVMKLCGKIYILHLISVIIIIINPALFYRHS